MRIYPLQLLLHQPTRTFSNKSVRKSSDTNQPTPTTNKMARKNNRNKNKRGPQGQAKQDVPPFSVVAHKRTTLDGEHGKEINLTIPAVPLPLAVRTHVRYHIFSHQPVNIRIRPTPFPTRTLPAYQSGWIKVADWDDVDILPLLDGDIHVTWESRGFVQQ
jgi:hypothetical protein